MEGGGGGDRGGKIDFRRFLCGGVAGCIAKTAIAPLDRVKILYQISSPHYPNVGVVNTVRSIFNREGFAALWKGNFSTVIRIFPYASIQFFCYDYYYAYTQRMLASYGYTSYLTGFLAGAAAGATASFFTYPLDIIRARLASQVEKRLYTGVWHGLNHMYHNEGLASFAKGMSPTLLGVLPYAGISFGTNDSLKKLYLVNFAPDKKERDIPTQVRLVCGAIAGLVAQTVTYPLDLVRRQMQLHGFHYSAVASYAHKGTVDAVLNVWRREGHKGLYKGLSINYLKAGPMISLSFTINDTLKRWLDVKEVR